LFKNSVLLGQDLAMKHYFVWILSQLSVAHIHLDGFDAKHPLGSFSALMFKARQGMQQAQSNREQVVEVLRVAAAKNLGQVGNTFGDALGRYAGETALAEAELEAILNTSQSVLSRSGNSVNFNMTLARVKGHLQAEINGAKQQLHHMQHQDAHELRTARELAKQTLESEADKFETKLGDMSETIADVEKKLVEHVAEASDMVVNGTLSSPSLDRLQGELEAAEFVAGKQGAIAKKRLRAALAGAGKNLTEEDAKILDHIGASRLQALSGLFSPALEAMSQNKQR